MFRNRQAKLPSNPRNWPKSNEFEINERPKRVIKIGNDQEYEFHSNFVKTSKYELYNFLPKFFMEEFNPRTKIANCYFLMISGLQCIPQISNTGGVPTTLLPLIVVVLVDAIFQILEDISRHKADMAANSSSAMKFNQDSKKFEKCIWSEIAVGDFIQIHSRSSIPADVIILATAEKGESPQGICYVETKSLDGETNLKIRNALQLTYTKIKDVKDLVGLQGDIEMEHPNKLIESFNGVIDINGIGRDAIQPNNVLLRGCVLRNTDWVIGLVVNTGHDTKIMMSSTTTKSKSSNLESRASTEIGRIIIFLALLCFLGSTLQAAWNAQNDVDSIWYLHWNKSVSPTGFWFIDFFYFFLLHATFIPVSLYVSMSIVRYFQSFFMINDLEMYYTITDSPALVRTMTLNEELGQVSHIFSDKTGTLTCNIMDFRKSSIHGISYGLGITEIGKAAWKLQGREISAEVLEGELKAKSQKVAHVSFYDPKYSNDMKKNEQKGKIQQFFRSLSICHDVIPEKVDGKVKLSASNPDDEALVCAAKYFGFEFIDRRDRFCVVLNHETGDEESVEVLNTIAFTSKRKRMSVIIRDTDGFIKIISKGADTVMLNRLHSGQDGLVKTTLKHVEEYSTEGLRCLYIASSVIDDDDYLSWNASYHKAITDLSQIERKKRGEANQIEELENVIESKLTLLGATAIEDRLQDGVPECIAELVKAGINIWVLTGDKEETAINIAIACNLVLPKEYMHHVIVNASNAPNSDIMKKLLEQEIQKYDRDLGGVSPDATTVSPEGFKHRALIIDGPSLIIGMADPELKALLLEFSQISKAVVGCRVSPDQKREMVNLVKVGVPDVRTLAIGDGANDVAMIQEAHIGVGIKGEEGVQAVNSADYAIAQFRYLSELLLKHGRYNYIRMSSVVCYMFYKNILMSIAQFWFNFNCAFSGQKYYTEGVIQLYNLAYTSIPILLLGFYDMDISAEAAHTYPQSYQGGINHDYFNTVKFWGWIVTAVLESLILSIFPLYALTNSEPKTGNLSTFWEPGAACFTAIIIVVNLKMFFIQSRWYWFSFLVIFLSVAVYFASAFVITNSVALDWNWYNVWNMLMANGSFWLTTLLLVTSIMAKDVYVCGLERNFNFKPEQIIQEIEEIPSSKHIASAVSPEEKEDELDTAVTVTNPDELGLDEFNSKFNKINITHKKSGYKELVIED